MIDGDKVRLRPLRREDVALFVEWLRDPEVAHHLGRMPFPRTEADERRWVEKVAADESNHVFAIEEADGAVIGSIGLHNMEWGAGKAELGIVIGEKRYWDQGYGTDAVRALLGFAFDEMGLRRISLTVFDDNPRAVRVYEKCGFRHEGVERVARDGAGAFRNELRMGIVAREFREGRSAVVTGPPPGAASDP